MKTPTLSTVYLDNQRIGLMGDPMPQVAKIVAASGKAPETVRVRRGEDASDTDGVPVRLEDTIDRTADPETPIYLTCVKKDNPQQASPARVTPSSVRPNITRTQFSDVGETAEPRARGPLPPLPDNQPTSPPSGGAGVATNAPTTKKATDRSRGDPNPDASPEWRT